MPFDIFNIPGVSPRNALLFAQAARLSYEDEVTVRKNLKDEWDINDVAWFDKDDTQAFAASDEDNMVIAFRGTQPNRLKDWLSDTRFLFVRGPWGYVHIGFLSSLDNIWADLLRTVKQLRKTDQRIWVTGHSLGGALAVMASARLYNEDMPPKGVCTFGQPRVGNSTFARVFDKRFGANYARYVNDSDVVANVPHYALPFSYRHIGKTCFFFDAKRKLHRDYTFAEGMSDLMIKAFKSIKPTSGGGVTLVDLTDLTDLLADHSMDLYIKNLKGSLSSLSG